MSQFSDFLQALNLRRIAIIYALLQVISWLSVPEIRAYFSSIGFIVIPILVGFALYLISNSLKRSKKVYSLDVRSLLKWWMLGLIALTVFSCATSIVFPSFAIMVGIGLSVFALFVCFIWGGRASTTLVLSKKSLLIASILAIGILIPFLYWRHISTFPFMLGDDMLSHLTDISAIMQGIKGIGLVDDAFILLIGIVSQMGGAQPLWLFWSGPLIQYAVMAIGIYLLSRKVINSYYGSIFAALLPLWFMGDATINDLIFFLRRNVLMALIPLFILFLLSPSNSNDEQKSKPSKAFLCLLILPLFFYFDVSSAIYNSGVSKFSFVIQALLQPGFAFTSPDYTFGMPVAMSQFIYAFVLTSIFLFVLMRFSNPSEKKDIFSWALISFVSFLIDYRMGLMLSLVFYIFILLKKYHSNKVFFVINVISLSVIGLAFAGLDLSSGIGVIGRFISQISGSYWSIQQKTSFLSTNYTDFYLYLALFSLAFLSFVQHKKAVRLSLMTFMASFGLAFYLLFPTDAAVRFLIIFTPLIVLLIIVAVEILIEDYLNRGFRILSAFRRVKFKAQNGRVKLSLAVKHSVSKKRIAKIVVVILLIGVGLFYVTQPYISEVEDYVNVYGPTGSVSTFTPEDLKMADWLKNNMPSNTLIISDPDTINILSGLAGMPLTLTGRYYVNGLDTATIAAGKQSLFTEVLASLNINALATLVNLYENSNKVMGITQSFRIVVVINDRTTAWVSASWQGYEYASKFNSYPGLSDFNQSSFSKSLYNVSSSYLSYELSIPELTTMIGPNLTIQFGNSSVKQMSTIETYYDPNFPNFTLTLSGSNRYKVDGIFSNWLLDTVETSNNSPFTITQSDSGNVLTNTDAESKILIKWTTPIVFGNVTSNFVQWDNGWQIGPYSKSNVGALTYKGTGGTLELNLANGVKGGYCSVYTNDLQLSLNSKSVLLFQANATSNAELAIALILPGNQKIFLFNNANTWFSVTPDFEFLQQSNFQNNITVCGLQIFLLSTNGASCQAFIKSFVTLDTS